MHKKLDLKGFKIGILTFHNAFNYGAYLQAYCLSNYIKKNFNANVSFLNYKNKRHYYNDLRHHIRISVNFLSNIYKIFKFYRSFKYLKTDAKLIYINKRKLLLAAKEFDLIIFGSDIIWDFNNSFTGSDLVYFSENIFPKKFNISYAASMGKTSKKIPLNIVSHLRNFRHISVRDDNTQKNLIDADFKKAKKVLDPTLLQNVENIYQNRTINMRYLLLYLTQYPIKPSNELIEKFKEFSIQNNCKIISVGFFNEFAHKNYIGISPFEWLDFFANAKYIITNTFHGTIFSILYSKKFITYKTEKINNKVLPLLESLNLTDRSSDFNFFSSKTLVSEINYFEVMEKLKNMRRDSIKFIYDSLNDL